jgi:methyltransferase (TIGR00027 family)
MREDYSRTAEGMALLRAIEQVAPPATRIIDDPYAVEFLRHPALKPIARSRLLARLTLRFMNFWAPGAQEFLTIRPQFVDELTSDLAGQGLAQVVMLGAGFDTMPLRIRDRLRSVEVFEVDHPATQAAKRETLARLGVPPNVRFVAADFEKDDFVEKLRAAGFDPSRRTLISWLGVTYYLTDAAMARALTQIASLGGAGTWLVFDYMLKAIIDGTSTNREALSKARRVAALGEPWLFGIDPPRLGEYLAPFGFSVLQDYGSAELRAKYCPHRTPPMSYVRLAVCARVIA